MRWRVRKRDSRAPTSPRRLSNAAKSRVTTRPLTLQEFPSRVLLQCMGRAGPNVEQIARDLDALLSNEAGTAAAPAGGAPSLDMT